MKRIALVTLPLFLLAACSSGGSSNDSLGTPSSLEQVAFDPQAGTGTVSEESVRDVLDWDQDELNENAERVQFRAASVTEVTWECTNHNNQVRQERSQTTTMYALVTLIERDGDAVQGFVITGYDDADPIVETNVKRLDYCPAIDNNNTNNDNPDNWWLSKPAGEPQPVGDVTLMISGDDGQLWMPMP
jgi:hypothetical protein